MAWSRFEPGFTRHPKRLKCGPLSSWLWICSVDHCTVYKTDGFLDTASVKGLIPGLSSGALKHAVTILLDVGSWETTPGGYHVHGYLDHNLTKAQVEANQAAGRRRFERFKGKTSGVSVEDSNGVINAVSSDVSNAVTNALATQGPNALRHRLGSRSKSKDVDSGVDVTARRAPANHPGSESAPGVLDRGHPSRRPSAGSRPALVGDLIGGVLGTPPPSRYAEILQRIKAEKPELGEQEQENQALAECERQAKGSPR